MNLLKTLTKEQLSYLQDICEGRVILLWNPEDNAYFSNDSYPTRIPHGNDRQVGRRGRSKRPWLGSCVMALLQRKVLVDEGGRLMPSKEATKLYGRPAPIEAPKKIVKMKRTRPARDQNAPPKTRKPKKPRDRTGEVWERSGDARLIIGPPKVLESRSRTPKLMFEHPSLCLLDSSVTHVAELENEPFEGKDGYKRLA